MAARRGAHPPLPTVSAPVGPAVTAAAVGARGLQLGRCSGRGRRSHPDLHRFETSGERRCGRGVAMLLRNESPGAVILLSREESRAGLLLLSLGSWKASNLVPFRTWGTAVGLLLAFLLGHSGLRRTPCLLADRLSPSLDCLCLEERWGEGEGCGADHLRYLRTLFSWPSSGYLNLRSAPSRVAHTPTAPGAPFTGRTVQMVWGL